MVIEQGSLLRSNVERYAAAIGQDLTLVQGAGGNVSWKDGNVLWIKASGTWLADALKQDIFVPIDLERSRALGAAGAEDFSPALLESGRRRPSIETPLHALMTQRVVSHVHSVDAIAWSVLADAREQLAARLGQLSWCWIDYAKPGRDLSLALAGQLRSQERAPNIVLLGNHGLVVAGDTVDEVERISQEVCSLLARTVRTPAGGNRAMEQALAREWQAQGYAPATDESVQALACDPDMLRRAKSAWVLYPDHAVFLGAAAPIAQPDDSPEACLTRLEGRPPVILVPGKGVIVADTASLNQRLMLGCYAAVLCRLQPEEIIRPLSQNEVAALLNLEQEKYRQRNSK